MKYVITGGAGNISRPLAEQLIAAGHTVTVIGRSAQNLEPLTALGAIAAIGSVEDADFLQQAFAGADAVYCMVPPSFSITENWKGHIARITENYAKAIRANQVKYVVNLSSIGAHMPDGCGPVSGLHRGELVLNALEGVHVLHLRPGFFYYNFLSNIPMVKQMNIIGANYGSTGKPIVMSHTGDIAAAAFDALNTLSFTGKSVRYLASDERTGSEVAAVLGAAIGQPQLPWVVFSNEQALGGMLQAGLPEEIARNYAEMGNALETGEMIADFVLHRPAELGKTKLEQFATTFAAHFQQN